MPEKSSKWKWKPNSEQLCSYYGQTSHTMILIGFLLFLSNFAVHFPDGLSLRLLLLESLVRRLLGSVLAIVRVIGEIDRFSLGSFGGFFDSRCGSPGSTIEFILA